MNPLNLSKTNTTRFMLAMIFNDDVTYNNIVKENFQDSYTSDFYEPENDGYILLVKTNDEQPRGTIHDPIKSYQRDSHFIFVYEIPDKYKTDYFRILTGNFGELSNDYKTKLLNFWCNDQETSLYYLLNSDTNLRKIYSYDLYGEMYRVRKDD